MEILAAVTARLSALGYTLTETDSAALDYLAKVAVRCTVFPNLNDAELQQSYGVMGAEQLITTMLTPAEFEDYSTKVLQVNGFQSGDEMVEEAKN